ncbi:hypothetical protein Ciccas_006619 [Cichlidogyrus casuarinus]|uniref:Uncharacterized protein n=1 Tax=Cichlidogyrus casuarinus TaxID=1844966 RepID=A0ABD2Q6G6_9PLAT
MQDKRYTLSLAQGFLKHVVKSMMRLFFESVSYFFYCQEDCSCPIGSKSHLDYDHKSSPLLQTYSTCNISTDMDNLALKELAIAISNETISKVIVRLEEELESDSSEVNNNIVEQSLDPQLTHPSFITSTNVLLPHRWIDMEFMFLESRYKLSQIPPPNENEVYIFSGPVGCGKSSLLRKLLTDPPKDWAHIYQQRFLYPMKPASGKHLVLIDELNVEDLSTLHQGTYIVCLKNSDQSLESWHPFIWKSSLQLPKTDVTTKTYFFMPQSETTLRNLFPEYNQIHQTCNISMTLLCHYAQIVVPTDEESSDNIFLKIVQSLAQQIRHFSSVEAEAWHNASESRPIELSNHVILDMKSLWTFLAASYQFKKLLLGSDENQVIEGQAGQMVQYWTNLLLKERLRSEVCTEISNGRKKSELTDSFSSITSCMRDLTLFSIETDFVPPKDKSIDMQSILGVVHIYVNLRQLLEMPISAEPVLETRLNEITRRVKDLSKLTPIHLSLDVYLPQLIGSIDDLKQMFEKLTTRLMEQLANVQALSLKIEIQRCANFNEETRKRFSYVLACFVEHFTYWLELNRDSLSVISLDGDLIFPKLLHDSSPLLLVKALQNILSECMFLSEMGLNISSNCEEAIAEKAHAIAALLFQRPLSTIKLSLNNSALGNMLPGYFLKDSGFKEVTRSLNSLILNFPQMFDKTKSIQQLLEFIDRFYHLARLELTWLDRAKEAEHEEELLVGLSGTVICLERLTTLIIKLPFAESNSFFAKLVDFIKCSNMLNGSLMHCLVGNTGQATEKHFNLIVAELEKWRQTEKLRLRPAGKESNIADYEILLNYVEVNTQTVEQVNQSLRQIENVSLALL